MASATLRGRGALLTGLGIGAGLMFFLDPERGRRRRALVRDQFVHSARVGGDAAGATRRDLMHRATGVAARLRDVTGRAPVNDTVLVERVRAQLGRAVTHPRAIDVEAHAGVVTLRGPVLRDEVPRLLRSVGRVRGVREVVNVLDEHERARNVPALQNGGTPARQRRAFSFRGLSLTARLLAGTAATALAGAGYLIRFSQK
jgi:osmotically-inducible protein OsmY